MASDRFDRLREIVDRVLDAPPERREALLSGLAEGDEELRRRATKLLDDALADDAFLVPPAPAAASLEPGTEVGPYRVVRLLGSGGMGQVYEAEQDSPRRRVALKVMKPFAAGSLERFRHEAELLAALRHPGIAHVYGAGVLGEGGRELPWFAMEVVEGARSLLEFARDRPREERVALFAKVADAVHHGHARGIIHRDLKPDNILVDAEGAPRLIDFGVARALDGHAGLTRAGEIFGTVAYMSPEQVRGDPSAVDTRSDVYALGVVLYELLTGDLPYGDVPREFVPLARAIVEEPPRRRPDLRGDLETIVNACLEKDPERRYASAAALAADLRRFLAREPISAHPPSLAWQIRMFSRRHRALVASAVVLLLASVAAAVVSASFAVRARRAEADAEARGEEAAAERDRARELFETVLDRSVATTYRFAPRMNELPGGPAFAKELLTATVADLEALVAGAGDEPGVRLTLADAIARLADVQGNPTNPNLGDRAAARAGYRRALEIGERLRAELPGDPKVAALRARVLSELGLLDTLEGALETAAERFSESLRIREELADAAPDDAGRLASLASAHDRMRGLEHRRGNREEALRHTKRQLDILADLRRREPENADFRYFEAVARCNAAAYLWHEEDFAGAREGYAAAIEGLEALVEHEPETVSYRMQLAWASTFAGWCEERLGRLPAAEERTARARDLYRAILADDPQNAQVPAQLANSWWALGVFAEERAEREPAARRAHLERARDAFAAADRLLAGLEERGALGPEHAKLPAQVRARLDACVRALESAR